MKKGTTVKLRSVYGIAFSFFTVFVGALFIMQTWAIYRSAPQSPYSVESISKHFNQIALPVWLWVAALVGNILLAFVYPEEEKRPKAYIDMMYTLSRIKQTLPAEREREAYLQSKNQRILRTVVYAVCTAVLVATAVFSALTLCDIIYYPWLKTEFFASTNGVADRLVQCVAFFLGALTVVCVGDILVKRSLEKEKKVLLEAKLRAIKEKGAGVLKTQETATVSKEKRCAFLHIKLLYQGAQKWWQKHKTMGVWSLRVCIFILSIALLIIGVCNGGMQEVLLKAINICTQCIGLG